MPRETDTTKVTVIDTIPYYKPVAKDSVVVRYERVKLPTSDDKPYYASLSLWIVWAELQTALLLSYPSRRSGMGTAPTRHG